MDFHQFIIPRLNGETLKKDFPRHLELVKRGVAGFIVFGGEVEALRDGIRRLQAESALPLLIASDLEQGLGQQVRGGTLFPPARALKEAAGGGHELISSAFSHMAEEAAYAGINTILAPVLDLDTNPRNPIISTRAFGERAEEVSSIASWMIRALRARGIRTCGKHFPGHGGTEVDSHISLPVVKRPLDELEKSELVPFSLAVREGVDMIMPGHLSVPAIDPSGTPISISALGVEYLREKMGFKGIIITDAMNMGALAGRDGQEAALMALKGGVDLILHPEEPLRLASGLNASGPPPSPERLIGFRKGLLPTPSREMPPSGAALVEELTERAIRIEGPIRPLKDPLAVILSDEEETAGEEKEFAASLGMGHIRLSAASGPSAGEIPRGRDLIVAVFTSVRAWKEDASAQVEKTLRALEKDARILISFGSPHVFKNAGLGETPGQARVYAYWGSPTAQRAVARRLLRAWGGERAG